jgi:hypothetical protein
MSSGLQVEKIAVFPDVKGEIQLVTSCPKGIVGDLVQLQSSLSSQIWRGQTDSEDDDAKILGSKPKVVAESYSPPQLDQKGKEERSSGEARSDRSLVKDSSLGASKPPVPLLPVGDHGTPRRGSRLSEAEPREVNGLGVLGPDITDEEAEPKCSSGCFGGDPEMHRG